MGKTITRYLADLRIGHRYLEGTRRGTSGIPGDGFLRPASSRLRKIPVAGQGLSPPTTSSRSGDVTTAKWRRSCGSGGERERERGNRRATYTIAAGAVLLVGVISLGHPPHRARPLPPRRPPSVASHRRMENAAKRATTRSSPPFPASTTWRRRPFPVSGAPAPGGAGLSVAAVGVPAPSSVPSSCSSSERAGLGDVQLRRRRPDRFTLYAATRSASRLRDGSP